MTTPTKITGAVIALAAVAALRNSTFASSPGCCQMFAREVAESVGGQPQAVMDTYRTGTARQTMLNFRPTRFNVWDNVGNSDGAAPRAEFIQEGDYVYKGLATSGAEGHVGIVVAGHRVGQPDQLHVIVENSSYHTNPAHMGNVSGAKGWRTIEAFGPYEMVVRLTETE